MLREPLFRTQNNIQSGSTGSSFAPTACESLTDFGVDVGHGVTASKKFGGGGGGEGVEAGQGEVEFISWGGGRRDGTGVVVGQGVVEFIDFCGSDMGLGVIEGGQWVLESMLYILTDVTRVVLHSVVIMIGGGIDFV